jgi:hypothetical protein
MERAPDAVVRMRASSKSRCVGVALLLAVGTVIGLMAALLPVDGSADAVAVLRLAMAAFIPMTAWAAILTWRSSIEFDREECRIQRAFTRKVISRRTVAALATYRPADARSRFVLLPRHGRPLASIKGERQSDVIDEAAHCWGMSVTHHGVTSESDLRRSYPKIEWRWRDFHTFANGGA